MSGLLGWYVQRLASHPWQTNLASAAVFMTVGDVSAQWLEHVRMQQQQQEEEEGLEAKLLLLQQDKMRHAMATSQQQQQHNHNNNHPLRVQIQKRPSIQYRVYGKLSPPVERIQHELWQHKHQQQQHDDDDDDDDQAPKAKEEANLPKHVQESIVAMYEWMEDAMLEWDSYDWFRTTTMVAWSTLVYTPYFVSLFGLYACYLPTHGRSLTLAQASVRAILTFSASIPLTVAFFGYGCTIHYLTEYFTNNNNNVDKNDVGDDDENEVDLPTPSLGTEIQLKLQAELPSTLQTGAVIWIPVNFANFAIVPAHLRPVALMSVSVVWNAYLSLAQHRDVDL